MSSSHVEVTRLVHRDIDAQKEAIVKLLSQPTQKAKEELFREYELAARIKILKKSMSKLSEIYLDKDRQRETELSALTGDGLFNRFYRELNDIREFHQQIGPKALRGTEVMASEANAHEELGFSIDFSQAENMGRFLDMYDLYQEFISLNIYRTKLKGGFDLPPNITIQSHVSNAAGTMTLSDELNPLLPADSGSDDKPADEHPNESKSNDVNVNDSSNSTQGGGEETFTANEVHPVDYLLYLSLFDDYALLISKRDKLTSPVPALRDYHDHLVRVHKYLAHYHSLLHPLVNVDELDKICREDFKERYDNQQLVGWHTGPNVVSDRPQPPPRPSTYVTYEAALSKLYATVDAARAARANKRGGSSGTSANIGTVSESTDAMSNTKDETKVSTEGSTDGDIESNPLFCKPCGRLMTNAAVFTHHLKGKKHIRAEAEWNAKINSSTSSSTDNAVQTTAATSNTSHPSSSSTASRSALIHNILELEYMIGAYADLLQVQIISTRAFMEKKHTKTYRELLAELEAMNAEDNADIRKFDSFDDDEEADKLKSGGVYNPLNLPLDWDGKPIPYWLYKLHGLNIKYECEICCGAVYRGPRDFYKHFTEWRHQHAMKQFGIPNTPHFMNITRIDDAKALLKKLEADTAAREFNAIAEEEVETESGDVLTKGTAFGLRTL